MTKLTLYGLKNCDTCKKALKAFQAREVDLSFMDIRSETDLANKVPAWIEAVGVDQLLNKRSTTWRALNEEQQANALAGGAEEVLISNPTLIKRPVIETEQSVYVGWTKEVQAMLTLLN